MDTLTPAPCPPTPSASAARADPTSRAFAWVVEGRPVSAAGMRQRDGEVEVLHLGTAPGEEGRGYARALLHALAVHLSASHLVAETDGDAAGFSHWDGFEVTPLPSPWDWARSRCVLTLS